MFFDSLLYWRFVVTKGVCAFLAGVSFTLAMLAGVMVAFVPMSTEWVLRWCFACVMFVIGGLCFFGSWVNTPAKTES